MLKMKSLFESEVKAEILERIEKLKPDTPREWGTMIVSVMLKHCCYPLELALMNPKPKRNILGYLIGGIVRKKVLALEPFEKNGYTPKEFVVKSSTNFETAKKELIGLIKAFEEKSLTDLTHPFFGKLSLEEWSWMQYKHLDHHLRQFGV